MLLWFCATFGRLSHFGVCGWGSSNSIAIASHCTNVQNSFPKAIASNLHPGDIRGVSAVYITPTCSIVSWLCPCDVTQEGGSVIVIYLVEFVLPVTSDIEYLFFFVFNTVDHLGIFVCEGTVHSLWLFLPAIRLSNLKKIVRVIYVSDVCVHLYMSQMSPPTLWLRFQVLDSDLGEQKFLILIKHIYHFFSFRSVHFTSYLRSLSEALGACDIP